MARRSTFGTTLWHGTTLHQPIANRHAIVQYHGSALHQSAEAVKQKEITDWKGGDLMPEAMVKLGAIIERVLRECEDNDQCARRELSAATRSNTSSRGPLVGWSQVG